MKTKTIFLVLTISSLVSAVAFAADPKPAAKAAPNAAPKTASKDSAPAGSRKKELNFEERVIEGLNGKGYESLTQTGSVDDGNRAKLYKKRADFDEETKNLLKEMEYLK